MKKISLVSPGTFSPQIPKIRLNTSAVYQGSEKDITEKNNDLLILLSGPPNHSEVFWKHFIKSN